MIPPATSETILVVDDDRPLRELIEVILMRAGYEVLTAADGEEALQCARDTERIHLLLTDLEMPGMDGGELASRFAAFHPAAPLLFITGAARRIETTEPFTFLAKPFTTDELRGAVRHALRMSSVFAENAFAT
jgi:DNA-binding NtrC family response regulator